MENFETRGEWWLRGERSNRVAGTLKFDSASGGTVELIGSLTGDQYPADTQSVDTIFGFNGEEYITLKDGLFSSSDSVGENWIAEKVFVEALFDEDIVFNKLSASFPLLEEWAGKNTIRTEPQRPPNDADFDPENFVLPSVHHEPIDPVVADLESAEIKLTFSTKMNNSTYRSTTYTNKTRVVIEPSQELCFRRYLNYYLRNMQQFLCLGMAEPVTPKSVAGYFTRDNGSSEKVDIFTQMSHSPDVSETKHPSKYNFNPTEVDFDTAVSSWFDDLPQAQILRNFYFGTRYNEGMYEENRLLSLVTAIESYHDAVLFPDYRIIDEERFTQFVSKFLDTLPENDELQKRLEGLLRSIGNRPSLRSKIEKFAREYESAIDGLVNIDDLASDATNKRHTLSHGLSSDYDIMDSNTADRLQLLIDACLLDLVGLDSDHINKKLRTNYRYRL